MKNAKEKPKKKAVSRSKPAAKQPEPDPPAEETSSNGANLIRLSDICGAAKKSGKGVCQSKPMKNGRCRVHGGSTPAGVASPNFKHGRYSKYMPEHLLDRYEELRTDPDLVSNREQLALINTMIAERLESIYDGHPPAAWQLARNLWIDYCSAVAWNMKNPDALKPRDENAILVGLGELLEKGLRVSNAFHEIDEMLETHRKHVDTEYKRLKDLNAKLDVGEAVALAQSLAHAVKRHIKDPKLIALIQADIKQALS